MLKNFLEHTRCHESAVDALLSAEADKSRADVDARESDPQRIPQVAFRTPALAHENFTAILERVRTGGGMPDALFGVDLAIDMLRMERYIENSVSSEKQRGVKSLVRKMYYLMRPLFPVSFRKYLQRAALRDWDSIPFPTWPVDVTTENLMEATWGLVLKSADVDELPFIWFWPDGHLSACIMTHDVETKAGRDFCSTMMRMERCVGISSAFEVVPEERYAVPGSFLQDIRDQGCEVCIHGLNHDGRLFSSSGIFFERAKKINAYAEQWHALGFRSPVMYRNLEWLYALNFAYDMSVPNVGHLDPQRGGCCTVMPYFIGDMVELPLTTVQDYSLFNILQERSLDLWIEQTEAIRAKHGLMSFIIHPDYVNEDWSSGVYDALLDHLARLRSDHDVWIALPREVNAWWRARREMRLVNGAGGWKVMGPNAEHARVAYARLSDDRISYRLA